MLKNQNSTVKVVHTLYLTFPFSTNYIKSLQLYNSLMLTKTFCLLLLFICTHMSQSSVGYNITEVRDYKLLKKEGLSSLYEINSDGIKDGRPIKLLELIGSHYQIGNAYGSLLGDQIVQTYNKLMQGQLPKKWQLMVMELFLDWQFNSYVSKQLPMEFIDEINGISTGGKKVGHHNLRLLIQRILVVSSFPGNFQNNTKYLLVEEFKRFINPLTRHRNLIDLLEQNTQQFIQFQDQFIQDRKIHCSFFATWGNRTLDGKLFSMRNLDWNANTGINVNKIIFVFKIDGTIPHLTLGFPGILGALAGMSAAGLTVHQAGLDTKKQTQLGFQWTLRLRYVMMHAHNLQQAKAIWERTNNTLGMNHMITSASDVKGGHAALVMETMAGYTAYFQDHDSRQDHITWYDPKQDKNYTSGYSMPEAVFRTNHGYDPKIMKHLIFPQRTQKSDTMTRYLIIKDGFQAYSANNKKIDELDALELTARVADKGGYQTGQYQICPNAPVGINLISVMFIPNELRMYAAFEYGTGEQYRVACCSVYLSIDMRYWFGLSENYTIQ